MPLEIERKFLVADEGWRADAGAGKRMRQGYLARSERLNVRIRIIGGEAAFLTLKGARAGSVREEFEYPVPVADAEALMPLAAGSVIEKTRYRVPYRSHVWEVDVFAGDNDGLVTAEVELSDSGETFAAPPWLGDEVTEDRRYYNAALAERPYCTWRDDAG